jgi:hypothetical protein
VSRAGAFAAGESGPNRGSNRYRAWRPRGWTNILIHISRTGGDVMKLITEARVECIASDLRGEPIRLAVLDRMKMISSSWG